MELLDGINYDKIIELEILRSNLINFIKNQIGVNKKDFGGIVIDFDNEVVKILINKDIIFEQITLNYYYQGEYIVWEVENEEQLSEFVSMIL